MENNQTPFDSNKIKIKPQKQKMKKESDKKVTLNKLFKVEGIWLLLWVNIKKAFSTKTIIAMGIVFLIISFIFNSISMPMIFSSDMFVGKLVSWIGYIFIMFFYIIFLSLLAIILVKTPILEGISQIETRAGVAIWKSYLIRFSTYLLIAFAYCAINMIIVFSYLPLSANSSYLRLAFIISPPIFLFIFAIIWFPLITFIALICSQAMGIFTNIFIGAVVAVVPVINALIPVISGDMGEKNKDLSAKTIQLKLANNFYQNTKYDPNVKGIYQEDAIEQINKNIEQITLNFVQNEEEPSVQDTCRIRTLDLASMISMESGISGVKDNSGCVLTSASYNSSFESKWTEYLERAFYLGQFNMNVNQDGQSEVNPVNTFDDLYINEILTTIFNEVNDRLYEVPVGHPGFEEYGIYAINGTSYNVSKEFLDISDLVKWLSKELPEYKNLLTLIEKQYNKYKEIIFDLQNILNEETYVGESFSYIKRTKNLFYTSEYVDLNQDAVKVYKRHPELALINNLIIQNWLNVYTLSSSTQEGVWNTDSRYGETLNYNNEKMFALMRSRTNSQILGKYINPTYHISSMWNGLFGKGAMLDFIVIDTDMEMLPRGLTKSVSNIKDFAQFSSYDELTSSELPEEIVIKTKMNPMFETVTPKFNFGYSAPLVAFIYVMCSLGFNALVYLAYKKQSRI